MSVASIGIGIVSKVAEFSAQAAQAEAVAKSANSAAANSYAALGRRQQQEQEAAAQREFETSIEAKRAIGSANVSGGEANVEGVSFNQVIGEFLNRFGRSVTATRANADMTVSQIQDEKYAVKAQAENRIASAPSPSKMGLVGSLGLGIIGGGYDAYKNGDFDDLFGGNSTVVPTYSSHYNPTSGY